MRRLSLFIVLCFVGLATLQAQHVEFKWHGLYGIAEYAHLSNVNRSDFDVSLNSFTAVVGWQIRKESAVGFGFGYLSDPSGAFSQMPLFIEFRSHFLRSRLTPFTAVQVGYSFPTNSSSSGSDAVTIEKGGINFALMGGVRFAVARSLALSAHVGYQLLHMNEVVRNAENMPTDRSSQLLHNIRFGFGVHF